MANQAFLQLPIPTLDIIGWENTAAISGDVVLALPVPVLGITDEGTRGIQVTLPVPTLAVAGVTGQMAGVVFTLPVMALAAGGVTGQMADVAFSLPTYQISIGDGSAVRLALPKPVLTASAVTGAIGSVSLIASSPVLAVSGAVPYIGDVELSVLPQLAVSGATGNAGATVLALRSLALVVQGATGSVGDAAMALPVVRLSASGYGELIGNVVLTLPMLALSATNVIGSGLSSTTIVMHTESNALTAYDNYAFNSFAQFNGVYLGAKGDGIFALSGATDNGAMINAVARVGLTDFNTSHLKRIDRCYVGYRADGNLILRVFTDEATQRDYLLTATGKAGMHGNHVRIGKGLAARYWQFEIQNKDGADFSLDVMEMKPTPLRRRIGGGDA